MRGFRHQLSWWAKAPRHPVAQHLVGNVWLRRLWNCATRLGVIPQDATSVEAAYNGAAGEMVKSMYSFWSECVCLTFSLRILWRSWAGGVLNYWSGRAFQIVVWSREIVDLCQAWGAEGIWVFVPWTNWGYSFGWIYQDLPGAEFCKLLWQSMCLNPQLIFRICFCSQAICELKADFRRSNMEFSQPRQWPLARFSSCHMCVLKNALYKKFKPTSLPWPFLILYITTFMTLQFKCRI